jgi:dTDP-4-dehydrorhamnose reductase
MKKDDSFIQKVTDRLGHDRRYALNSAKLHALGWKPKHDFESALKATIDWYTQNESWWKPLKEQKVMILGAQGMLGKELSNVFPKTIQLDLQEVDITNQKAISECIAQNRPDVVINAAAYTDVDGAEANKEIAHKVNADAVLYIAEACKGINATLIHYSTDYIFNGQSEKGYAEDQSKDPINAYGETKAIGEDNIIKTTDNYYILRTSWLYGNQGKNFVETMLKLAKEKDSLKVINDQTGSPTYAKDLAEATKNILKEPFGIYHRTNDGSCTWYEFAKEIFTQTNTDITLEPCTTQEYPTPAKRPTCSILINNKLNPLPDWKDALSRYLKEKEQLEESP